MAKPDKEVQDIEKIVGSSVRVDDGLGGTFLVPSGPQENRTSNQILAAQLRHYIQQTLKRYKDGDKLLTPAELRQLAEAAKIVAQFSGEVYKDGESTISGPTQIKTAIVTEPDAEAIDFTKHLTKDDKK